MKGNRKKNNITSERILVYLAPLTPHLETRIASLIRVIGIANVTEQSFALWMSEPSVSGSYPECRTAIVVQAYDTLVVCSTATGVYV